MSTVMRNFIFFLGVFPLYVLSHPTTIESENDRESYLKEFENKIIHAARTGKRAELIQLQKFFETEILLSVLKSLNNVSDIESIIENLVVPDNGENISKSRRKRSLGLLTSLLGSSSGSSGGGGGGANGESSEGGGGSDSGSILSLLAPLLGSSSGGGGGSEEGGEGEGGGGGGSGAILSLIGPLLGSSSGGGRGSNKIDIKINDNDSNEGCNNSSAEDSVECVVGGGVDGYSGSGGGEGRRDIRDLITILGGHRGGGGGGSGESDNGGGGGGSDLSSILSLSSSSSNGGGGASAAAHKR